MTTTTLKIVIDVASHLPALEVLQARNDLKLEIVSPPQERARELNAGQIADADILFTTFLPTNHAVMTKLRWVQVASTGYTQLHGHHLPARGIRATNARGCSDVPIAEWNIAMMINLARDLRQMIRNQDAGVWDRTAIFQNELRGRIVGLWGYGGIGRETARLSRALGLRVHVLSRRGVSPRGDTFAAPGTGDSEGTLPDRVFSAGQELEFLGDLDFLVVALPLSPTTESLIGERELQALPRRAYVLNPARGPIVQQAALLRALRENWIAGAAIDTHYQYPLPPEHPLWKFPNVILTPHIAGSSLSPKFKERLWEIFTQNIDRFAKGEKLLNEIDPRDLSTD